MESIDDRFGWFLSMLKQKKAEKEFLNILRDRKKWPDFKRPDFLEKLNHVADTVYKKRTIEGYLASFLIYQQLCEEFLRILIETTHMYVQCSVFPSYLPVKKLQRKTFGQLIEEYEACVQVLESKELIDNCKKLNQIRIDVVHKIINKNSLNAISNQAKKAKQLFENIWDLFNKICDDFRVGLKDYKKEIHELEECLEMEEATNGN